jgi:hypothetical protein
LAHESREVGNYRTVVGFDVEPAFEGIKNAAAIRISTVADGGPVEGLQDTLQVEITYVSTGASRTMELRSPFGQPGYYVADFIPTSPGHYRFRFFGTIEGMAFDETYESRSGGGNFDDINPSGELQFPEEVPSARELESAVRGVETTANEALAAAEENSGGSSTLAIVAIVLAIVGIAVGGAGIVIARRPR